MNFIAQHHDSISYAFGPLAWAGLSQGYNFLSGLIRGNKANDAITELAAHHPKGYEITPELQKAYDDAQGMKGQGFTQNERLNFNQGEARKSNTGYQRGIGMGGNSLAGALNAALNSSSVMDMNRFAAQDAGIRRQNILHADSLAGQMTQQRNLNTQRNLSEYDQQMAAYGGAARDSRMQRDNAVNLFGAIGGGLLGNSMSGKNGTNGANGSNSKIGFGESQNMQPEDLSQYNPQIGTVGGSNMAGLNDYSQVDLGQLGQGESAPVDDYDSMNFGSAFGSARKNGLSNFKWRNNLYNTKLK